MGLTYKGKTPNHHSLRDNLPILESNPSFQRNGNHYGQASKNGASVTTIKSDNPLKTAQEFFDKIALGGLFMNNSSTGQLDQNLVYMNDGTIIY